jgi:hypothetical protein
MSFVAFPMRLENGFLRRVDGPAAMLALIELMARTPHGSWPGSPHFGLRDYLQASGPRSVAAKTALDEINRALADLEIPWRVESLTREEAGGAGSAIFALCLVSGEGRTQVVRLRAQD